MTVIEIYTIEDLDDIRNDLTASYKLMNDLDFNNDDDYANSANKTDFTTGSGWVPLGNTTTEFSGTFDGNSKSISNLYINNTSSSVRTGFFGYTSDTASIDNLSLLDVNIKTTRRYCGGLIAYSETRTITNIKVTGIIEGINDIGGFIGNTRYGSNYSNIEIDVKLTTGGTLGGGLVGYLISDSSANDIITNCHVNVELINGATSTNTAGFIGRIILFSDTAHSLTIEKCYTTGTIDVAGISNSLFVGEISLGSGRINTVLIRDCYSRGQISNDTDKNSNTQVGGFAGYVRAGANSVINRCYSIVAVYTSATSHVGAMIGRSGNNVEIDDCFYDKDVSILTTDPDATGLTTSQSKITTNYINWTIEDSDEVRNDGYPFLGWEVADSTNTWLIGDAESGFDVLFLGAGI